MSNATVHPIRSAQKKKRRRRRRPKSQRIIDDLAASIVRTIDEVNERREEQADVRPAIVKVEATVTFKFE